MLYAAIRDLKYFVKHKKVTMEKKFKVLPPMMPNFVRFEREAGVRQDGFKSESGFDIADFSQQEAEEFADLMRQTFMDHYAKRKASKSALREITE